MDNALRHPRLARALLTLGCFEFFGIALRDANASHLLNPAWVGHARFHLAWMLCFMVSSGVACLVAIWAPGEPLRGRLRLVWAWQLCVVLGFWSAAALAGAYGGEILDVGIHRQLLGVNENVLAFGLMSALAAVNGALVWRRGDGQGA